MIKKFLIWIAGFFEDQGDSASSKRLITYATVYFLYMQVKASVSGTLHNEEINKYVLYATVILLLFEIGAITSEFITLFWNKTKNDETKKLEE
jgi:hypothetical protein